MRIRPSSARESSRTRRACSRCERRSEPRSRPALPGRREHPRRDRSAGRARAVRRRARDRRRAGRPDRIPRRARLARPRRRARPRPRAGPRASRRALHELEPAAGKLVANLPYQIATPSVVEGLDGLPTVQRWCVMVQREVADRFFAAPGTRSYGAVSVLIRLTAERTGFHPVARTCFRPPPNVDSVLVAFRRTRSWGEEFAQVKHVVQGAFAHRRKTLANSLELAGVVSREGAVAALAELGKSPDVRAEALEPAELERLASLLA
ncbi:MAG: hypothetical protein E6G67_13865 [Actinobacteria bacterium]|nr:MAG: hypothetical protein E6G67_13865 [Actinomycetota bacterium]